MVHLNAPFLHELLKVSVAQWVAAIPPNSLHNDVWKEVSPAKKVEGRHQEVRT